MIIKIIFILLLLLLSIHGFLYKASILQNQYYSIKRYLLYKIENPQSFILNIFFALSSFILIHISFYFSFIFLFFYFNRFYRKNLKLTNRIIIQLFIFLILLLLNVIYLYHSYSIYLLLIYNIFVFWVSFAISFLIEKIKTIYFIKKAKNKLKKYNIKTIAITGSYGKTSCKNYIYEMVKDTYTTLITPSSYNTLNGILLTINKLLKPYHQLIIFEIGVDCKNGMNKFIKNFNFDYCLISALGRQHIKTFKTLENIVKEKTKLLYNAKHYIVINKDISYLNDLTFNVNTISCSIYDTNCDVFVNNDNERFTIKIYENTYYCSCKLKGKHNTSNLACCVAMAKALNIDDKNIIGSIERIKNVDHRLSIIKKGTWNIIDDSYNSNYIGFFEALNVLNEFKCLKVLITPGIIEQAKNETEEKELALKIMSICDLIILINNPFISNYIDNKLSFNSFLDAYTYLKTNYQDKELALLIENDVPDIYLK